LEKIESLQHTFIIKKYFVDLQYNNYNKMIQELKTLQQISQCEGKGSQDKMQAILKSNLTPEMEFMLDVAYNPFITTKLNKLTVPDSGEGEPTFAEFKKLIDILRKTKAANNDLRKDAGEFIAKFPSELRQTMLDIITKNLNIGIQAKSINKAAGRELIPNPSLMLSEDDVELIETWDKIYCEHKYDGVRIIAIYKGGEFQYFTRNFNQISTEYMRYVDNELHRIIDAHPSFDFEGWFFDGELTDHDRKSVSGKLNRMLKGKVDSEISKEFMFNIFDIEHENVLRAGKGVVKYLQRREMLEHFIIDGVMHICISERWEFDNVSEMMKRFNSILNDGGEGVICKNNGVYECKRSRNWIKLKEVNDCDLVVTGWIPGEGRRTGFIGGLVCEDKTRTLQVGVGSGFSDGDLQMFNDMIASGELIGKIITVQYNMRIQDKHGNHSLFLPRFIDVRSDKMVADDIENIK
jgi:DNA ligase-1